MNDRTYVYAIHIATTAEKLWQALTDNTFIHQYWGGEWRMESDWKAGSALTYYAKDGSPFSEGEILESKPPEKLSYTWPNPPAEQGDTPPEILTWEITSSGPGTVMLKLIHSRLTEEFLQGVSQGWPAVLSNLKSLLEMGRTLTFHPRT
jgi:uncharacterized protein YndB with AHSA1/START domain